MDTFKKRLPLLIFLSVLLIALLYVNSDKTVTLQKGEYYRISHTTGKDKNEYTVTIWDLQKKVAGTFTCRSSVVPSVTLVDENVLAVQIGMGTEHFQCRYYDLANDRFSDYFDSPVASAYGRVALLERKRQINAVVVRDMFEGDALLAMACDFASYPSLIQAFEEARFVDENTLYVRYEHVSGEIVEETFVIQ